MTRDRHATEQRILEAVGHILADTGFQAIGINAVAHAAGIDKVLIYRYFGGLPELLLAYGETGDFWWTVDELLAKPHPGPAGNTLAGWVSLTMRRHLAFLRTHPITRAILAWETVEHNELTAALAEVREARSRDLARRLGACFPESGDPRWRGITALLGAACTYLVVRAPAIERYGGVPVQSEAGWQELEAAMDFIIQSTFAPCTTEGNI